MEDDNIIFRNGNLRRWWLLKKALSHHNLVDALKLAREAEEFITAADEESSAGAADPEHQVLLTSNSEAVALAMSGSTGTCEVDGLTSEEQNNFNLLTPDLIRNPDPPCVNEDTQAGGLLIYRKPTPESDGGGGRSEGDDQSQIDKDLTSSNTASSSLAVLASIQEVVTFLRRCDDVVVSTSDRDFFVNGRFLGDAAELVRRANRIRSRQGKPPFEVLVSKQQPARD